VPIYCLPLSLILSLPQPILKLWNTAFFQFLTRVDSKPARSAPKNTGQNVLYKTVPPCRRRILKRPLAFTFAALPSAQPGLSPSCYPEMSLEAKIGQDSCIQRRFLAMEFPFKMAA
jgi:hypothetical protein